MKITAPHVPASHWERLTDHKRPSRVRVRRDIRRGRAAEMGR